jgi:hypothetical protein
MAEGENVQTANVATPAPGLEPAVATPAAASSFDAERRSRLAAWSAAVEDPAVEAQEIVDAIVQHAQGEVAVDTTEGDEVAVEAVEETKLEAVAPTPEEEAAPPEVEVEPAKPKHFAIRRGEEDFSIPEDVTLTYKAEGTERTRTLDEVIRYAQLGENYDRRSRELAQAQRDQSESYQRLLDEGRQQVQAAWNQVMELTQKLHEDDEFRENYFEEYERLKANPEEIELRRKASLADLYEKQIEQQRQREYEEWNRSVWTTVDTILEEQLADYEPDLRGNLADRVRSRFYQAVSTQGNGVISESYLTSLIREERGVIDLAVERARREAERDLVPVVNRAKVEAAVETRNKITDQSLQRNKEAAIAPTNPAAPVRAAKQIKTMTEASNALKNWANS